MSAVLCLQAVMVAGQSQLLFVCRTLLRLGKEPEGAESATPRSKQAPNTECVWGSQGDLPLLITVDANSKSRLLGITSLR